MSKQTDIIRKLVFRGWSTSREGAVLKPDGSERATRINKSGRTGIPYRRFNVKDSGVSRPVNVHKLVAYMKFGEESFKWQTRHLNGNSLDNSFDNIAIGSGSQNMMDRPAEDRKAHGLKAARILRKLSDEDVKYIRQSLETGLALAERFRVAPSTISGVRNNKIYRSI